MRYRAPVFTAIILGIVAASVSGTIGTSRFGSEVAAAQSIATTVQMTPAAGLTGFSLGVTHTQNSADSWGNPTAVASARGLLSAQPIFQNQSIMGWGVNNPEPAPGVYSWSTLDARMALIESTHGVPVVTLAGAPDWMQPGGVAGQTNWANLGVAPTPAHFADFANLAKQVALRYPNVKYYQVWNELKGFWNTALNRWDYEDYTTMYNDVYNALKSVNPMIQVGGPYVVMSGLTSMTGTVSGAWGSVDPRALAVVTYWLAHKVGADFIAVDADTSPQSGGPLLTDEFTATQKFSAIDVWLRQQTSLPIWWSELYVQPAGVTWTPTHQAAVFSAAVANLIASGASVALLWSPQGDPTPTRPYLWTDTSQVGGGQPTPLYTDLESIVTAFQTPALSATTTSSMPRLVAGGTQSQVLVINGTGQTQTVSAPAGPLQMPADSVTVARA